MRAPSAIVDMPKAKSRRPDTTLGSEPPATSIPIIGANVAIKYEARAARIAASAPMPLTPAPPVTKSRKSWYGIATRG